MKLVAYLKRFYHVHLKCPANEKFDDDFGIVLQVLYFFGFYQPKRSKKRIAYGCIMFTVIILMVLIGALKDSLLSLNDGNLNQFIMNGFVFVYSVPAVCQILGVASKPQIVELVKKLQNLHEFEDENVMKTYRERCTKIAKFHRLFLASTCPGTILLKFLGLPFKLFIPALYGELAEGNCLYFLMALNAAHHFCLVLLYAACDLLHILCMVRVEANLKILNDKIRHCTDSYNLRENEKALIACMRYHSAIFM